MRGLTLQRIAEVTEGTLHLSMLSAGGIFGTVDEDGLNRAQHATKDAFAKYSRMEISSITTDSRKAEEGALFGAIVGARVDGHDFVASVFEQGALCVLSQRVLGKKEIFGEAAGTEETLMRPWIEVDDTQSALQQIAREYLRVMKIPVVGITGSVGKTSTKEMIAAVLSVKFNTLKTEGNFNNDLGLPLTVFRLRDEHQIAVLEMGVSHFGDMTRLARIANPDIMVITNIGTCHLEFLRDRDGVFRAKTEVFSYVKQNGRVILNGNDDKLRAVREVHGIRPTFYGVDSTLEGSQDLGAGMRMEYPGDLAADQCVRITGIQLQGFEGSLCTLHTPSGDMTVRVPVPGIHNASNAAAAAAVGLACGMTPDEIRRGIESAQTISGRFRVLKTDRMTVIDDCYNANPVSMKSSVAVLEQGSGRRVAVLGDMGELGEDEVKLHEGVGTYAAGRVDHLAAIGTLAKSLYEAALREKPDLSASWYATVEDFLAHKDEELKDGDSVLVKASHFMQFSKIVEELTA